MLVYECYTTFCFNLSDIAARKTFNLGNLKLKMFFFISFLKNIFFKIIIFIFLTTFSQKLSPHLSSGVGI